MDDWNPFGNQFPYTANEKLLAENRRMKHRIAELEEHKSIMTTEFKLTKIELQEENRISTRQVVEIERLHREIAALRSKLNQRDNMLEAYRMIFGDAFKLAQEKK